MSSALSIELGGTGLIAFDGPEGPLVVLRSAVTAIGSYPHSSFGPTMIWIGGSSVQIWNDFEAALKTWRPELFLTEGEDGVAAVQP